MYFMVFYLAVGLFNAYFPLYSIVCAVTVMDLVALGLIKTVRDLI